MYGVALDTGGQLGTALVIATPPTPSDQTTYMIARADGSGIAALYDVLHQGQNDDLHFARYDAQLAPLVDVIVTSTVPADPFADLAVASGAYAFVWNNNDPVHFGRLDPQGMALQPVVNGAAQALIPVRIASHGGSFAVAWSESPELSGPLHVTLFDSGGAQTSDSILVDGKVAELIATSSGYAIAWTTSAGISLAELDPAGKLVSAPVHITDDVLGDITMLWDGTGIAMAWSETDLSLYFMRVRA